ncbi:MAG: hypothetical protein ACP5UN_02590 [Candidatus Micrarchaeia archaeon]
MPIQKGVDKWKLKKWFLIIAPKMFNEATISEMPVTNEKKVVGRNIVIGLDVLTGNPSHADTNATLKVVELNGERAITKLIELEMVASYIKSFVRRYKSIAHVILPTTTKDGKNVVLKLIAVTRTKTATSKLKGLRKEMSDFSEEYFKSNDLDSIIKNIIDGNFQTDLGTKVKHIAELSKLSVRKLEIKS